MSLVPNYTTFYPEYSRRSRGTKTRGLLTKTGNMASPTLQFIPTPQRSTNYLLKVLHSEAPKTMAASFLNFSPFWGNKGEWEAQQWQLTHSLKSVCLGYFSSHVPHSKLGLSGGRGSQAVPMRAWWHFDHHQMLLLPVITGWQTAGRSLGFATHSSQWVRTPALPLLVFVATKPFVFWDREGRWQKLQLNGILYSMVRGSHSSKTAWAPSLDDRQSSFVIPVKAV